MRLSTSLPFKLSAVLIAGLCAAWLGVSGVWAAQPFAEQTGLAFAEQTGLALAEQTGLALAGQTGLESAGLTRQAWIPFSTAESVGLAVRIHRSSVWRSLPLPLAVGANVPLFQAVELPLLAFVQDEVLDENFYVGAYFAWYKILIVMVVYLIWVLIADRTNVALLRWGKDMDMNPTFWNVINLSSFGVGLLLILFIPIYWIGLPLFLIGAFLPPILFRSAFQTKVKSSDVIAFKVNPTQASVAQALPQDEGAEITFYPAGASEQEQTRAMILARQSPAFPTLKNLVANLLIKRADLLMLDYTHQGVAARIQVDGAWHVLPGLERGEGDGVLMSFKYLSGLNPLETRARQRGRFRLKYPALDLKTGIEFISQGTGTGERVQLKILRATGKDMTLSELGLSDGAKDILLGHLNQPGITIISSPPREGLSSTWRAALLAMDRYTRDCVAIIDDQDGETEIENLNAKKYAQGSDPAPVIRNTLLTQPDALVVPQFANSSVLDHLTDEALNHNRAIITQIQANSASEALLKLYAQSKTREAFAKATTLVTCQRLVRKLCNECKVPFPVKPDFVQRLGGNPNSVQAIFRPFVPPPPEQQVDEAGKPLEIPICPSCQGLGYLGRTVVIELLVMNDPIRKVLREQPQVAAINEISRRTGNLDLMGQAYQLVLQGDTSIEEIKRVFQVKS